MNKSLLIAILLTLTINSFSQITIFKRLENDSINRWSLDINIGQSKGIAPYTQGYYSSNPEQYFGSFAVNHLEIGGRYMFTPKVGLKFGYGFDQLKNNSNTKSLPFKLNMHHISVEGVVNLARLFELQKGLDRLGFLFHGGLELSRMTPMQPNTVSAQNYNISEYNGGLKYGITPTYRITDKIALMGDISFLTNYRQHFAWDGFYSNDNNNLGGSLISYSGGMSISIGDDNMHGDWAEIPNTKSEKENELDKRVGEIETLMNDSDKDGVPDYLDQENNSTAGVAVDSRGKMVDLNGNGVPDEMERYLDTKFTQKNSDNDSEMVIKYINDGYVAAYFDTNVDVPTNVSTQGIGFMLNYLKNNPKKSISIIGFADEIGDTKANNDLSDRRAKSVKDILLKSGVAESRLILIPAGEDNTVDKDSDGARRLVRKVTFRVEK
jgi:OmpA-OmpF porin, OOP family